MNDRGKTRPGWLLPACGVLLVAFAARVHGLEVQSLWHDEGLSWWFARQPLGELIRGVANTEHPPLYFLGLAIWLRLAGDSAFALRFLSVLGGVLTVALTMALARQWRMPLVGLLAAAVLALHPWHIWYSQEVRSYSWMAAFGVALTWLGWRWTHTLRPRDGVLYAVVATAALYVHVFLALLVLVHFIVAALPRIEGREQGIRRWRALWPFGGAALVFLPWFFLALAQVRTNRTYWYWGFLDVPVVLKQTGEAFVLFPFPQHADVWDFSWAVYAAWGVAALVSVIVWRRPYGPLWVASVWGVLGLTLGWAYIEPKYDPRYVIDALPLWVMLVVFPLAEMATRGGRLVRPRGKALSALWVLLIVGAYGTVAFAAWQRTQAPDVARPDFRSPARFVAQHAAPGDGVVLVGGHIEPIVRYYLRRPDIQVYPMPRRLLVDLDRLLTWWDVAPALNTITRKHRRVWVIRWQEDLADPQHLVRSLLTLNACPLPVPGFNGKVNVAAFQVVRPLALPSEPTPTHKVGIAFRNGVLLLGYDAARVFLPNTPLATCEADRSAQESEVRVAAGETLFVVLYLQATNRLVHGFTGFVHLVTPDGSRALGIMDRLMGGYALPPPRWQLGQVVLQEFPVPVPPDIPPGQYLLEVGLYYPETLQRIDPLPAEVPGARTDGSRILMGPVYVIPK